MSAVKKIFLISVFFALAVLLCSCKTGGNDPGQKSVSVDFSKERAVRCVFNEKTICYRIVEKDGGLLFSVDDEASAALFGTEAFFNGDDCRITSNGLSFSRPISVLPDDFLPKILYAFISEAEYLKKPPEYNEKSGAYIYSASAQGRFVLLFAEKNGTENGAEYDYTFKITR